MMSRRMASSAPIGRLPRGEALCLLVGVIRTAHERPGFDVAEAQLERDLLERTKLVGRVVARHRQVGRRRAEVLADCEDLAIDASEIAEHLDDLVTRLTETEHQAGLSWHMRRPLTRARQELKRAGVSAAGPRDTIQPRHGF